MSKAVDEINCLKRLNERTHQLDDILMFLKQEEIIGDNEPRVVRQSADKEKELYKLLNSLKKTNKVQLLQYEWSILPVENIRIHIITDRNQREFTYNG